MGNHKSINKILVSLFNNVLKIEEDCICSDEHVDLSINEMHVIDSIGLNRERTMSDTAKDLQITSGTLTTTINNLVKKGYVFRTRSEDDRRLVYIRLSPKGVHAYKSHEKFHDDFVFRAIEYLNEEKQLLLIDVLSDIDDYFKSRRK
jgi:DNA-binding MarR family transcriptional regulator